MRRKTGALVPLEQAISSAAALLSRDGTREFHGYELAKTLGDAADTRLLTANGTLYRALGRLEAMGCYRAGGKIRRSRRVRIAPAVASTC